MRHPPNLRAENYRVQGPVNSNSGAFIVPVGFAHLKVIVSDGGGWDHVSVSLDNRCPRWEEMEAVKQLFFKEEEVAMQLHPAKSEYKNQHPYCLHIWRPQTPEERLAVMQQWANDGAEWPAEFNAVTFPNPIPLPPLVFV